MPRNEDGEFELVLGNKQLLSVFFLVVILMSIFFLMCYIVALNSAPVTLAEVPAARTPRPMVVESPTNTTDPPRGMQAEKPVEPALPKLRPGPGPAPVAKKPP